MVKKIDYIPYNYLKNSWEKVVLNIIKNNFKDNQTKQLINKLYKSYENRFYVNSERDLTNIKQVAKYIGRYLARPAITKYNKFVRYII